MGFIKYNLQKGVRSLYPIDYDCNNNIHLTFSRDLLGKKNLSR